jgi:hypothetical protein
VKVDLKAIRAKYGTTGYANFSNWQHDIHNLCDRVEALEAALKRLADTWDRLGPPTTATLSGRPTAIQQARALLAHQPPPSERPMHVGGSAATQDGIAGEMSVAACSNCGCSRPKVHFQGYGPSELGVCPECGTADDLCRKCARPPGDCRCCEPSDGYALCVNHQTPRDDCPMCSPTETREACATCGGSGQIWMTTGGAADCYDCGGSGRAR